MPLIAQPDKCDVLKRCLIIRLIICFFRDSGSSRDDEGHFTLSVFIRKLLSCRLITLVIRIYAFTATARVIRPHVEFVHKIILNV